LLGETHHGDVFELRPRRRIDEAALAADFVVVSHRHPDHFDVASLHRLAQLDRDSVVLTSDPLVERTARAVGFSTVARVTRCIGSSSRARPCSPRRPSGPSSSGG
ncbi:MAG: hypothetical protein RIF41_36525, partial [Polyangiaceae bacterium]